MGGFAAAYKKDNTIPEILCGQQCLLGSPYTTSNRIHLKALEIIKKEPAIRARLWENTDYLRSRLTTEGFDIGKSVSPIFPIMIRDNKKVYEIAKMLQEKGIFTIGIVYPAVRTKEARLRVSVLATHEHEQLDALINALNDINKDIKIKKEQ